MFCSTDYKDEVLAICQRAETDVQMEFSLQNCEEVWLSKVFELKSITRKRINVSVITTAQIANLV